MSIIKKSVLVFFIFLVLTQLSFADPVLKIYDDNYDFIILSGFDYFNAAETTIDITVDLGELEVTNFKLCNEINGCSDVEGETYVDVQVTNQVFIVSVPAPSTAINMRVYLDDVAVGENYLIMKKVGGSCTKKHCTSGCTSEGIATFTTPYVCENLGQTCEGEIVDLSECDSEQDCINNRKYNSNSETSCSSGIKFYNYIDPCGEDSDELVYLYENGTFLSEPKTEICGNELKFCKNNNIYKKIPTEVNGCECIYDEEKIEECISCQNGKCINELSSTINKNLFLENEKIIITTNKNTNIEIKNNSNLKMIEFFTDVNYTEFTLPSGNYFFDIGGRKSFTVTKCKSNEDCKEGICINEKTANAKCVIKECETDEDCIKEEGYDFKCNNALSIDSYCTYKNYTCTNDEDCITQVLKDAKSIKCLNPKTKNSSCSYANCEIKCENNNDCNDNNINTFDECFLPGTCQAQCINKKYLDLKEPLKITYYEIPYLDFELYRNEQCTLNFNGNLETIGILPKKLEKTIEGNNSLIIDCQSVSLNTWFFYDLEKPQIQTENNSIQNLREVLSAQKTLQIQKENEKLKDVVEVKHSISKEGEISKINTSLEVKEHLHQVEVYLEIPKCMAESFKEIEFENENFEVLIEDPLLMWHFDEVLSHENLIYRIKKDVPKECFDQLKVMTAISGDYDDNWWIYLAIIPVILFVYSYFSKFAVGGEEEEEHNISAVDNYVKILRKRVEKLRSEFSEQRVKQILMEEGISENLIEKAFK